MIIDNITTTESLDHSTDLVMVTDRDGNVIFFNRKMKDFLRIEEQPEQSLNINDHRFPLNISRSFLTDFQRSLNSCAIQKGDLYSDNNRRRLSLKYIISPINGDMGEVKAVLTFFREVTETILLEEERFLSIFNSIDTAMLVLEEENIILIANDKFLELTGYKRYEVVKTSLTRFISSSDLSQMMEYHKQRRLNPDLIPRGYLLKIRCRDNTEIKLWVTVNIIKGTDMSVISLLDLTEIEKMREHSQKVEKQFKAIVENTNVIMVLYDRVGNARFWNRTAEEVTGYTSREMLRTVGKVSDQYSILFYSSGEFKKHFTSALKVFNSRYNHRWTSAIVNKNGHKRIISWDSHPFFDENKGEYLAIAIGIDITEKTLALEKLSQSEHQKKMILEGMTDLLVYQDMDHNVIYANKTACESVGLTMDSIYGKKCYQLWAGRSTPCEECPLERTLRSEKTERSQISTQDGRTWSITSYPIRGEDGEITGILEFGRDISKVQKLKQELDKNIEEKNLILDSMKELLIYQDLEHKIIFTNRAFQNYFGMTGEELRGKKCHEIWKKSVLPCSGCPLEKAVRSRKEMINEIEGPNGTYWRSSSSPVFDDNGEIVGIIDIACDITEEKIQEKKARESEMKYHHIFETSDCGLVILDKGGVVKTVNQRFKEITGYSASEVENVSHFSRFFSMETVEDIRNKVHLSKDKSTCTFSYICKANVARDRTIYISTCVAPYNEGENFIVSFSDITPLKQAQRSMVESLKKLKKMNGSIVSAISQVTELRDPYTAGHQKRVAELAKSIALKLKIPAETRDIIFTAACLHDVGKLHIPSEILAKPGKITDLEYSIIQAHSKAGFDILKNIDFEGPIPEIVLQHHERLDGSGYPKGLKDDDILIEAKILSVADVMEAMTSHRPYRPALGVKKALEELQTKKGVLYDPESVEACITLFQKDGLNLKI